MDPCTGLVLEGVAVGEGRDKDKGMFQSSLTTCIVRSLSWLERHEVTFFKTSCK